MSGEMTVGPPTCSVGPSFLDRDLQRPAPCGRPATYYGKADYILLCDACVETYGPPRPRRIDEPPSELPAHD